MDREEVLLAGFSGTRLPPTTIGVCKQLLNLAKLLKNGGYGVNVVLMLEYGQ